MNTVVQKEEQSAVLVAPRVGQEWPGQGGIYQGVMRGEDGAPDYHLIVAKEEAPTELTWQAAKDWASGVEADGKDDFSLPTRYELSLCFAQRCDLFQRDWYWSSTQHASNSACAWAQTFGRGGQITWLKGNDCRARAVRRLDI